LVGFEGLKHILNYIPKLSLFYEHTSQPGPGAAQEKFDEFSHPSGHFTLHKVFSPVTRLCFRVWGTPGSMGWVGGVMLMFKNLP